MKLKFDILYMLLTPNWQQEGGVIFLFSLNRFWIAVMVNVTAYYICKWLDVLIAFLSN